MRSIGHKWRSIQSRILPWNELGSCRAIRWNRFWRRQKSERLFGFFFLFLRRATLHQAFQLATQACPAGVGQFQETKRLEASLCGPHGKQHLAAAADAGDAEVEHDRDPNAFVERLFERIYSAVEGQLTHAAADLTSLLE